MHTSLCFMGIDKMLGNQTFYQPDFKLKIPDLTLMVEVCVHVGMTEMVLFFQFVTILVTQQGS